MLELGIENKCRSYANIEVPDIFGLKNISYTDAYLSKDEIKKINKKLLK